MDVLARLVVIVAGYCLACLSGAAMLLLVAPETGLFNPPPYSDTLDLLARALTLINLILDAPVLLAAGLALSAVVLSEIARFKGWAYHALSWGASGALAAAASPWLWAAGAPLGIAQEIMIAFLAAGFVAGCVYWLVAGKNA